MTDRITGNDKETYICLKCAASFSAEQTQGTLFVKHGKIICPHCGSRKVMKNIVFILDCRGQHVPVIESMLRKIPVFCVRTCKRR